MAKELDFSESGTWNIAKDYANAFIFRPLFEAQKYGELARFGSDNIVDDIIVDDNRKALIRHRAMSRYIYFLRLALENALFKIKKKGPDRTKITGYYEDLLKIQDILPKLKRDAKKREGGVHTILVEPAFSNFLSLANRIESDMKEPLNKADLIFPSSDEFDPDELMKQYSDRAKYA